MQTLHVIAFSFPVIILVTFAPAYAQDGGADRTAAFFLTNPTRDFNATGKISSLVTNETSQQMYVLAGDWSFLVSEGNITDFNANITMIAVDGTDRHIHTITNFTSNAAVPVILDKHGTVFTGVTDMSVDGDAEWRNVQTTITISKQDTITILLNTSQNVGHTDNHFSGQPIYGAVFSIQDY